jgi:putative methyltransferase (TIGR04325 family)
MSLKNWSGKVWDGVYASFSEAPNDGDAFSDAVWKEKVLHRAKKLFEDRKTKGAIPKSTLTTDYALPFILSTMVSQKEKINVLDFGGGLGTSFIPLIDMIPQMASVKYTVVENKLICELGSELFISYPNILFKDHIPEQKYDLLNAGSSIHYVDDWLGLLKNIASLGVQYMIFSDLPAADNKTFVTNQIYYGKRIPVRFWNLEEFIKGVSQLGFEVILKSHYRGYYMNPDSVLPLDNFSDEYKPSHFSQLVFKRKNS